MRPGTLSKSSPPGGGGGVFCLLLLRSCRDVSSFDANLDGSEEAESEASLEEGVAVPEDSPVVDVVEDDDAVSSAVPVVLGGGRLAESGKKSSHPRGTLANHHDDDNNNKGDDIVVVVAAATTSEKFQSRGTTFCHFRRSHSKPPYTDEDEEDPDGAVLVKKDRSN